MIRDYIRFALRRCSIYAGAPRSVIKRHQLSWRFADAITKKLEYEIDLHWRGELPLTILLGRDGSGRSILGNVDFAELRAWIDG